MFSKINSIYLLGMEGKNVTVEADVSDGLPGLILVGYLASEVREGGDGDQESWTLPAAKEDHGQSVSGRFQKGRDRL